MTEKQIRQNVVDIALSYLGCKESDGSHKKIIDLYNGYKPLARGYKVTYTDAWCATFVSAVAIQCGLTDIMPTECSCTQMIELYKKLGRWHEADDYAPQIGDLIMYDWNDTGKGENKGQPEHVGMVVAVNGESFTVVEGNYSNAVKKRPMNVNGRYIRGYCLPDYASKVIVEKPAAVPVKPVESFKYTVGKVYRLQVDKLAVRIGAGTSKIRKIYSQLTKNAQQNAYSTGYLKKGTAVSCLETKKVGNDIWMRIPSGWVAAYYKGKYYIK